MQQAMWQQLMAQQQAAEAGGGRGRHKGSPADAAALQEQMQAMYAQMMAGMQPGKQAQLDQVSRGMQHQAGSSLCGRMMMSAMMWVLAQLQRLTGSNLLTVRHVTVSRLLSHSVTHLRQ